MISNQPSVTGSPGGFVRSGELWRPEACPEACVYVCTCGVIQRMTGPKVGENDRNQRRDVKIAVNV